MAASNLLFKLIFNSVHLTELKNNLPIMPIYKNKIPPCFAFSYRLKQTNSINTDKNV